MFVTVIVGEDGEGMRTRKSSTKNKVEAWHLKEMR